MQHYLQWLFTNMYIHILITYSCTKSKKMLWGLFVHLTNLLISFHQQFSVLLHQGTTFIHSFTSVTLYETPFTQDGNYLVQFCEAQPISAISLKICTPKLQLLHNTEWHQSTMLTDCLLPWLFRNKNKFPPFLEESKMAAKYTPLYISHDALQLLFLGG